MWFSLIFESFHEKASLPAISPCNSFQGCSESDPKSTISLEGNQKAAKVRQLAKLKK